MLPLTKHHDRRYTAFDGKLYLELRPALSPYWQARMSFQSKQTTKSTRCTDLRGATDVAERWYLDNRYRLSRGEPIDIRYTMTRAYRDFMKWQRSLIVTGESSEKKCKRYADTWNVIKRFFGDLAVQAVSTPKLEEFRGWRLEHAKKPLSAKTIHSDYILVRQTLKRAEVTGHLKGIPSFPTLKIKHSSPDWFDMTEYRRLLATSRRRCREMRDKNPHHFFERRELHAFILMMAHSCIRVGECLNLRWSDCREPKANEKLPFKKRTVLLSVPKGKVGKRDAIGMFGAVRSLKLLRDLHPEHQPNDKLFSSSHAQAFEKLLEAAKPSLRTDSEGRLRNQKTLRHTSIMMRCLYERDLTTIELARISGTSPDTLDKYYLRHLQTQHIQQRFINEALKLESEVQASEEVF